MVNKSELLNILKIFLKATQAASVDNTSPPGISPKMTADHVQTTMMWLGLALLFIIPLFATAGNTRLTCSVALCAILQCWLGFRLIRKYFPDADNSVDRGWMTCKEAEDNKASACRIMGCIPMVAQMDYKLATYVLARHQGYHEALWHWEDAIPIILPVILGFMAASRLKATNSTGTPGRLTLLMVSLNCITAAYTLLCGAIWGKAVLGPAEQLFRNYSLSDWWPFSPERMVAAFQIYEIIGKPAFHILFLWVPLTWISWNSLAAMKTFFSRGRPMLPGMASLACFGLLGIGSSVFIQTGELADFFYYHSRYVHIDPVEVKWHDCTEKYVGQSQAAQDVCFAQADKDWAQRIYVDQTKAWSLTKRNRQAKAEYLSREKAWQDQGHLLLHLAQHDPSPSQHYSHEYLHMMNDEDYAHVLEHHS